MRSNALSTILQLQKLCHSQNLIVLKCGLRRRSRSIFQSVGLRRRSRNCIDRRLECVWNRFSTATSVYRALCRSFESSKSPMIVSSIDLSSVIKAFLRKMTRGICRWYMHLLRINGDFDGISIRMIGEPVEIAILSSLLDFHKACFG